jgi:hypothetical protein
VPRLICVGRPGWNAEAALGLRERSPPLRRKVMILSGVSDLALAGLTARALFAIYNSFHEGWGLPVSESLAAGKLCVVPAHTGLLESGAPGAVFFPPGDAPALVATLARLIADPAHRATLEARIDRSAATRSWASAAADAFAHLAAPCPAQPRTPPALGERIPLAAAPPPSARAAAWGEAIREGIGWWWQEPWGCWTRDGIATLVLPLDAAPGTPLAVTLELRGPPRPLDARLRLRGEAWHAVRLAPGEAATITLQGPAGCGVVALDLDGGDGAPLGDRAKRQVGVGVVAVTAALG